jgi:hypothetical protein
MVGLSPVEGEALIVKLLEDKHIMLKEGKIITTDLAELEKTVQFYRKQTALERQREANKNK